MRMKKKGLITKVPKSVDDSVIQEKNNSKKLKQNRQKDLMTN